MAVQEGGAQICAEGQGVDYKVKHKILTITNVDL
jgi:hypothetical protein